MLVSESEMVRVVCIGASAGGLDACRKLLSMLPSTPGMAFILVQHLDPTHESMMVELLSGTTSMPVLQATDGMEVVADHLYLIPPGVYLSYQSGELHLTQPTARHGARLPFDFFLQSLATASGTRGVCVVLSGTGEDGALGCQALKAAGGTVIAQEPAQAAYDGMPRSAIATGAVDLILPVEEIPAALLAHAAGLVMPVAIIGLPEIVALLREKTPHDFTLYKSGTLERRIARRMALAGIATSEAGHYITMLRENAEERALLTEDLLINVTRFFRDPKVFDVLATTIVPELVKAAGDQPIRIWVAGCSTGEETYSLAMLFQEHISASNTRAKLQIFASDVDPQAIAKARNGLYAESIRGDVSEARLNRYFVKSDQGYHIHSDLRSTIVFAVQDVLSDPPFSQLALVSCRNLLIYLRPRAQAKIISVFNFALRKNAYLLLGNAETAGASEGHFELVSKPARLYRKITNIGSADVRALVTFIDASRMPLQATNGRGTTRPVDIAEICKKLLLENYSPAAVLINSRMECLYSTGSTASYMRVAPGYPSNNILTMMHPALRARTTAAIAAASAGDARIVMPGGRSKRQGAYKMFNIDIHPVWVADQKLLLICFVDQPELNNGPEAGMPADSARLASLEQELGATRAELKDALQSLELSSEEQNAINEEALSVAQEYQSTNEELLTSKEELQSLNEELTALNSQLQETLERSRMTSNDLQNILYSTDVATLFLDRELRIRFFTPVTLSLFAILHTDIGRPLTDLRLMAGDVHLLGDAASVLLDSCPIEREVAAQTGTCFNRRILPYRTHDNAVAGVVITFTDITERKKISVKLLAAQQESERANLAKSRFLAAASHDLRQPLQTLTLLSGLLGKATTDVPSQKLVALVDETSNAMAAMLNTLLDINQIDSGVVQPNIQSFPLNPLLLKLYEEFGYHAQANGLDLRMVACELNVVTDPALLEQMLRNLLANAVKYTPSGRILLGCRRSGTVLSVMVGDNGIGISDADLGAIFDEFHQLNNSAQKRNGGLGLGLSIVQRLASLLNLQVNVRSVLGKGSIFTIDVPFDPTPNTTISPRLSGTLSSLSNVGQSSVGPRKMPAILLLEDDEAMRELLRLFLYDEGYFVLAAADGSAAMRLVSSGAINPDLILADYMLSGPINGLQAVIKLRELQQYKTPVVILSGDTSKETLQEILTHECTRLSKPMKLADLIESIEKSLAAAPLRVPPEAVDDETQTEPVVFIVDDDLAIRETMGAALEASGQRVIKFASCELFLASYRPGIPGCLLIDAELPGMRGLELLRLLADAGSALPSIMMTGQGDIKMAVSAMQAGAMDFMEKPVNLEALHQNVQHAFDVGKHVARRVAQSTEAAANIAGLTARQLQIMDLILTGQPNKNIAADLGISQRTVEKHRSAIMEKTGAKSLPALARLSITASNLKNNNSP